jgi:hypothetical protein
MRQLPKRHAKKLVPAAKMPGPPIAVIPLDTTAEIVVVDERHDLRKNVFAVIHKNKLLKLTQ